MRGACEGGWYHLRQCPSRRAQLCLAYLSKHTSAQAWRRAAVQPVLDRAWIERVLPLGTWISPHHFRNLLVSQARRRRLEKCERVQNREGSESSLRVSYWRSNNRSTGRATHSIVLLRQHTVLLRCHLLQTDIANVMGDEQVWRAAPSQKMDQPRNLFRILNGTTVRAELAATAQAKHA